MKFYLQNFWNIGTAFSELTAALMFTFLLFTFSAIAKKYLSYKVRIFVMPLLFTLVSFVSVFFGWAIGNNIEMNSGKSFLIPLSALVMAIYYSAFEGLIMIFAFQIIGTILGLGLYMLMIYILKNTHHNFSYSSAFENDDLSFKVFALKETLAQLFLVGIVIFVTSWAPLGITNVTESDRIIEMSVLKISIGILSLVFAATNSFMFSPWLTLASWVCLKPTKEVILKQTLALSVQIAFGFALGYAHLYLGQMNRAI